MIRIVNSSTGNANGSIGTKGVRYVWYRYTVYWCGCRTELTKVSGTGIDVVPNLPKCPVPMLMSYRTYRSVRCRYFFEMSSRSFHARIGRRLRSPRCQEKSDWKFARGGVRIALRVIRYVYTRNPRDRCTRATCPQ